MKKYTHRFLLLGIIIMSILALAGCSDDKKEVSVELGTIKPEAIAYLNTTYGEFLSNGGEEAEFLHGGRYITSCPELSANIVFLGVWHEDTLDHTIEDNSECLRLEGKLAEFFTGEVGSITADEFIKRLSKSYDVSSEYRESGGTAYYVSDSDYLHIEMSSDSNADPAVVLEIACKEGEEISRDSFCWVMKMVE